MRLSGPGRKMCRARCAMTMQAQACPEKCGSADGGFELLYLLRCRCRMPCAKQEKIRANAEILYSSPIGLYPVTHLKRRKAL